MSNMTKSFLTWMVEIAAIMTVIDYILKWRIWSWLWKMILSVIVVLANYWLILLFVVFALFILALYFKLNKLGRFVAISFKDDFKKNLDKWEYEGQWNITPHGELSVTRSGIGGITRVGHLWTDYNYEFEAAIINARIGWIVRAQDLFNYYMIQLDQSEIVPHLHFAGRWGIIARVEHRLNIPLNGRLKIRTEVRGSTVRVFINGREIYYNNGFFSMKFIQFRPQDPIFFDFVPPQPNAIVVPPFTVGRVGFRMDGAEHGRFSRCRVQLL